MLRWSCFCVKLHFNRLSYTYVVRILLCLSSNGENGSCKIFISLFNLLILTRGILTLFVLLDLSFWFDTINLGWSIVYIEELQVIISK